jgi:hypothetical protein
MIETAVVKSESGGFSQVNAIATVSNIRKTAINNPF